MLNSDMIGGIIRALGPAIVAYLIGKGTIPAGDYGSIFAAVTALISAVWSVSTNTTGKVIAAPKP